MAVAGDPHRQLSPHTCSMVLIYPSQTSFTNGWNKEVSHPKYIGWLKHKHATVKKKHGGWSVEAEVAATTLKGKGNQKWLDVLLRDMPRVGSNWQTSNSSYLLSQCLIPAPRLYTPDKSETTEKPTIQLLFVPSNGGGAMYNNVIPTLITQYGCKCPQVTQSVAE